MKIFLDTIGCRLNQAEIESIALQFRLAGHQIVPAASDADLAVVNTCTVTGQAASDSRAAVRRAARLGAGAVAVTGCWATLEPNQAARLPGVTRIVPNPAKDALVSDLIQLPHEYFDMEPIARQPLPGLHARTRAFIKVQDGCDNACAFCITSMARGPSCSRPEELIMKDIFSALDGGTKEIVLTGVHLGAWGLDLNPTRKIGDLVSTLLAKMAIPRLRLSSLEPWDLDDDFFSLWSHPSLCRHLHLPLQSGCESVLKHMNRRITPQSFADLVALARSTISGLAVTTDVIVGFPGESDAEFAQTLEYIRRMGFSGGHVFSYSLRPGTPAARMKGQIQHAVARERSSVLREVFNTSAQVYRNRFVGSNLSVLWESTDQLDDSGWRMEGLTGNNLRVSTISSQPRWNHLDDVAITKVDGDHLLGTIQ